MSKNDVQTKSPGSQGTRAFCFSSVRRFALGVLVPTPDFDGDGQVTFADFLTFAGPLHFFLIGYDFSFMGYYIYYIGYKLQP